MRQRRFHPLLLLAVIMAVLLGACSSGGDDDATTTTTTEAGATGGDSADGAEDETTTTEGGDSGGSVDVGSDGQAYVAAMVESMQGDEDSPLTDEQAECFGTRFVDTIGVDRLQGAGITPEMMASDDDTLEFTELGLSEDEGNELYDHFGACGVDIRQAMLDSMAADEDTTPEMQACLEGVFTDENLRTFMVIGMTKGDDAIENDPAASALMSGLMGCAFMGMDAGDIDVETGDLGEG